MKKNTMAVLVLATLFAVAAWAAVTFEPVTGTGFVGKGDVQLAFGWNNAQLQSNAAAVTFTYSATDRYDCECYWETVTGNGKIIVHDITIPKHTQISASISNEVRKNNQFTGFILNGLGDTIIDGTVPEVGGDCPGNNPGTIIGVTLTSSSGGLFVNYGDSSVNLPYTTAY